MAQGVVHDLEIVQVHEEDGDAPVSPPGALEGVRQPVGEQAAVGETGKRVVQCLALQPFFQNLSVGDVRHDPLPEPVASRRTLHEDRLVVDPNGPAVTVDHPVLRPERLARLVGTGILGQHPILVFGVEAPLPVVDDAQPLLLRVAEQVLDLGAHVKSLVWIADLLDVGHGGDLLH